MSGEHSEKLIEHVGFVIGNGESRAGFDLNLVKDYDNWACNLSALDFDSQQAVAADRYIVKSLVGKGYQNTIWTRSMHKGLFNSNTNVNYFPELPYQGDHKYDQQIHWGSGLNAAMLACRENKKVLCFLGFDLYGSGENFKKVNNVYKDQDGYSDSTSRAIDPRHWIYQFEKLFKLYPQTNFVFIKRLDYPRADWDNYTNVYFDNYENLHKYLKDLSWSGFIS